MASEDRELEAGTLPHAERMHIYEHAQAYITAEDAAAIRRVAARYDKPLAVKGGYSRALQGAGGDGWSLMAPDGKVFVVEDGDVWAEAPVADPS